MTKMYLNQRSICNIIYHIIITYLMHEDGILTFNVTVKLKLKDRITPIL